MTNGSTTRAVTFPPTAPQGSGLIVTAAAKAPVRPLRTQFPPRAPAAAPPDVTSAARQEPKTRVSVLRVVCWQLALTFAVLAFGRPWPLATGLGVVAAVLLAVSTIRIRDRWLSSLLAGRTGHLVHSRSHDVGSPEHEPATLLALFTPGGNIRTRKIGEVPAGVLSRPEELIAVLRPRAAGGQFLRAAAADFLTSGAPGLGGQLVLHAGPVRDRPPRMWLAVRALRDADIFDDEDLAVVLANTVRRTLRGLAHAGLPADPLSEEDIRTALVALTHTGSGRGLLREDWRYWRAGPVAQAGFRLVGFELLPDNGRGPALQRLLAVAPGVAITVAVTAGHARRPVATLRVAATTGAAVDAAAYELTHLGERLGVRLERLDGRHALAVAATLPIGGEPL